MYWNDHHEYEGLHAFLGASQHYWLGWTDQILYQRYKNSFAADAGTVIHDLASRCIKRRIKLTKDDINLIKMELMNNSIPFNVIDIDKILNNTINFIDYCIDNNMSSEIILFYSKYAFGTTDAISFDGKTLKIADLKTGVIPAKVEQLLIYAALFCLEYNVDPNNIKTELRIFQSGEVLAWEYSGNDIQYYMDRIVETENKLQNFIKEND